MSPCSARGLFHAFIGSHVIGPVSVQLRERLRVCSEQKVRETYNGVLRHTPDSIRDQAVVEMGIMGVMEGAVHRSGDLTLSAQEIRVFWNQIQIIDRQGLMQVVHDCHAELVAELRELEVEDIIEGAVRQRFLVAGQNGRIVPYSGLETRQVHLVALQEAGFLSHEVKEVLAQMLAWGEVKVTDAFDHNDWDVVMESCEEEQTECLVNALQEIYDCLSPLVHLSRIGGGRTLHEVYDGVL